MYFRMLPDADGATVSYLLADLDAAGAVLIDPCAADLPVLQAMLAEHRLQLQWVLRTHEHDAQRPGEAAALAGLGAPVVQHRVPDDGVVVFGGEHLRVLATPGHTPLCLSFLWRDRLFCGGLLAVDACPYQPHPCRPEALWRSVTEQVLPLPGETLLFHGHVRDGRVVSQVHELRLSHPWFAGASRDVFLARASPPAARAPITRTIRPVRPAEPSTAPSP